MSIIHFSYASNGGASRAGRRASLACLENGMCSNFAFIEGEAVREDDIRVNIFSDDPANPQTANFARFLRNQVQWEFIPERRTAISNTLFSIPYPGADLKKHPAFEMADIIHLHWPTWGITPRTVAHWLNADRTLFWTLHDLWPMTGGCHYPAGCQQYQTICMKCPQLPNDYGLVNNAFTEKLRAYQRCDRLWIIAPSKWMADVARTSAMLGGHRINVLRNPVELDIFAPRIERSRLRSAFGIDQHDFVLMAGSFDLSERRKGVELLAAAIRSSIGDVKKYLPAGAKVHVLTVGKTANFDVPPDVHLLNFGEVNDDNVLADILAISDVVAIPSLEDNYPNLIIEAMACGTPILAYKIGGIAEMITDGLTGILVEKVGSVPALTRALLRFVQEHFQSMEMRHACRASVVANNDPAQIGRQLRSLYEEALGRPLGGYDPSMRKRALAAFAESPVQPDAAPGSELLMFPANVGLAARTTDATALHYRIDVSVQVRAKVTRILTVRTFHGHHSAHSGPYQFVRHLPWKQYETEHMTVPLGADLVGKSAEHFREAGQLMGTGSFGQQGNAWLAESEILVRCATREIDLVHYIDGELGGWLLPNVPEFAFCGQRRPAIVSTYHQPEAILKDMINADIIRCLDAAIVLCEPQRRMMLRYMDASRVFLIPHGIDTKFFRPSETSRALPSNRVIRLLLVGHWLRDLSIAMRVFTALKQSKLKFELTIVSPNFPMKISDPSIRLLSGLSDEELRAEYWKADLLYLPLIDATANNAVLEAMACGIPVISTSVGGVPEAVGPDAGVLSPAGDALGIAKATYELACAPERRAAMGKAARKRAERLSWELIGPMHDEVYKNVLSGMTTRVASGAA